MIDWGGLWRKLRGTPPPLRGAPPVRRLKSHSAQSGYVYQYFYEGYQEQSGITDYVFSASADRKTWFAIRVSLPASSIAGRNLAGNERYAIAKMALFQAFDERPDPSTMREPVLIREPDATAILETLGRA